MKRLKGLGYVVLFDGTVPKDGEGNVRLDFSDRQLGRDVKKALERSSKTTVYGSPHSPVVDLEDLMKPENHDKLVEILRYHLVPQMVEAKQLLKLTLVPTINGDPLAVTHAGKQLMIDNARVVKADIKASNGVIHAIDMLLIPDGK